MTAVLSPARPRTDTASPSPLRVLHLVGSAETAFMAQLSRLYAQDVYHPDGTTAHYAFISPGGTWRFGPSLDRLGPELSFADALLAMSAMNEDVDLMVPHMFCPSGMSTYRALFEDMLDIKVVGSPAHVTALCTDKAKTRAVVAHAGVRVPDATVLRRGEDAGEIALPVIVKPNGADNSQGLTLVRESAELDAAIADAFAHDDEILIEAFIPGREIRLCVVESEADLIVPAMMEYPMSAERPIREAADKLHTDDDGLPVSQTRRKSAEAICPAQISPKLEAALKDAALTAHKALGARHYSLFDFRVHEDTGEVFFLEAGLFWAFSEISMISAMLRADGHNVRAEVGRLWARAAERVPA